MASLWSWEWDDESRYGVRFKPDFDLVGPVADVYEFFEKIQSSVVNGISDFYCYYTYCRYVDLP
jgi:hypothetical protein